MKKDESLEPVNQANGSKERRTESFGSSGEKEMPGAAHIPDVESHLDRGHINAIFENPLAGIPRDQLMKNVQEFCLQYNLMDDLETFQKGALISQNPDIATTLPELNESEKETLIREQTHKWSQPWKLYWLASKCLIPPVNLPTSTIGFLTIAATFSHVLPCRSSPRNG